MKQYNEEKYVFELTAEINEQIQLNQKQLEEMDDCETVKNLNKIRASNRILRNLTENIKHFLKNPSLYEN